MASLVFLVVASVFIILHIFFHLALVVLVLLVVGFFLLELLLL
jgi:hypothetical protein